MDKRIAVIVACSIYNRKGLFNAVHQRILHLKEIADYQVDAYIINSYVPDYLCKFKRQPVQNRPEVFSLDGIDYKVLWYKNSVIDFILVHKFHFTGIFRKKAISNFSKLFKSYDLLNVHSGCNDLGYLCKKHYDIPYVQTWHGGDIHTVPFESKRAFIQTAEFIRMADYNFFVSKALMELSNKIAEFDNKVVLYNGRDVRFKMCLDNEKEGLRAKYGVLEKKVIGFVGNLIDVKNTKSFHTIFSYIYEVLGNSVQFWIIGDGINRQALELSLKDLPTTFWGNQPSEIVPEFMNCIDVLILPSLNEGLPLTTIEALSCGCHVVGSRVGGIPESIGVENTFDLRSGNFEKDFSNRVIDFIKHPETSQPLDAQFDWTTTALKENKIIRNLLNM